MDLAAQAVRAGDKVSTDGLGRAWLSLASDAVATVYHDTGLTVLDAPGRLLQLDEGTLLIQTNPNGSPTTIETTEGRVEAAGRILVHRLVTTATIEPAPGCWCSLARPALTAGERR